MLCDPQLIEGCDLLITESTYANAVHPPPEDLKTRLLKIIQRADETNGKVVIPAFSLGRTQQVLFFLRELMQAGSLPRMPIFVDSPLAGRVTEVFTQHLELFDAAAVRTLRQDRDLFHFPMVKYLDTPQESRELNRRKGPFVVIAASGMCENGRIRHHLRHAVEDEHNTIVLIGFQAEHTLGRQIAERQPTLRILDGDYQLNAKVEALGGLSAHADAEDFKWFFAHMSADSHIGRAFIVHGEQPAAHALAGILHDLCDEDPTIPRLNETFEV